ncbi:DNA end-binding protein Ku [Natranaerovirga pectinivora]|uniref:Non-homologous end joining protein Ku n=1 Tax=Natranaerovirga pectinivora TaxID=682400 RepID=A0A4R3ML63_9FIRM|nr:Ku protein [Natranaerovirga pectinivora]TCT14292.1 DNA end-binding protein Ku [Natranaerovirga pectinivora]
MRTMWKGSINFGLVNIPINMYTATENKDISFRQLHKKCNTPIKYKKTCPNCNEEVKEEDIVKGYEYEPGHFVILKEEDFAAIQSDAQFKGIEIVDFVNLSEIDPIYFDKSYYLAPQENGGKAYHLLREVMNTSGRIAIAKITIRSKQSLAALRVYKNALVLETIFYPDEVRSIDHVPGIPQDVNLDKKEVDIATQLVDTLTAEFNPEKYTDEYRSALRNLIEQKVQGKEVHVAPEAEHKNVIDLMEALQQSLKETTKEKKKAATPRKRKTTAS